MPKLIVSLDTEDYITPEATQGVELMAQLLERHGFVGNFCVVAELARRWQRDGRRDLIARLSKRHVVGYHSTRHSAPPLDVDLVAGCSWSEGVERIVADEREGLAFVQGLFGQKAPAYVVPGFDWAAQSVAAMNRLGIPIFINEGCRIGTPGRPVWFCNTLVGDYDLGLDAFFGRPDWPNELQTRLDELLAERGPNEYVVLYVHPNMLITRAFADALTFGDGHNPPPAAWVPGPLRSPLEIGRIAEGLDTVFAHLAAREDVTPATYRDYAADFNQRPTATWRDVRASAERWLLEISSPEAAAPQPDLSPADLLATLAAACGLQLAGEPKPSTPPILRALGPLEPPAANPAGTLAFAQLPALIESVLNAVRTRGALPHRIVLDALELGPAAALSVLARAYLHLAAGEAAPARIAWNQAPELPPCGRLPFFRDLKLTGTWPIFRPDLDDRELVATIRRQSWTVAQA